MKKIKNNKKILLLLTVLGIVGVYFIITFLTKEGIINRYYSGILLSTCINIILVVSLNVTTGFLGQLTLGHAGFMAVGAYTSAYLTKVVFVSLPPLLSFSIALVCGGVMALVFGIIIGFPTLRLRGDYLAIITLAFGEVIRTILLNLNFVGGAKGFAGIPRYSTFAWAYFLAAATVIIVVMLVNSRHGRAIISVREDEIAAEASGINTSYYKILAFIFAAFFAGVAGGLYAHYMGIIEPKTFTFNKSIEILVMVVLGGMGNIKGAIISAIVLTVLPELLRSVANYRTLIYALVLILMMLAKNNATVMMYINKVKNKLSRKEVKQ
ncbi:branched-chain amino acid ABC transporter permease [Anaerorhabdus sp.]|uniref:branched-chain amino acid ABC transporter permease n=1 Tax=Anaerorhabdus sp. TaxID=1872524 RepID=UPI002B20682A|nr:branched-chain amino acid ABC transporter permease [Anaerorhabdus sp.]MEA4875347.1 branched-chain amino acid ABC transporter permease [Anaerorhabdus sp.]